MTQTQQFFYDNAGYSYDPKTQTEEEGRIEYAVRLAEAEAFAVEQGWAFEWECDIDADPSDWDGEGPIGEQAFYCVLRDGDKAVPLASLCSIWDPTEQYRRVVEAELALEAMEEEMGKRARIAGFSAAGVVTA